MSNLQKQQENMHRKYFYSEKVRLAYLERGEFHQKILLLLHGHMSDAENLFQLADRFPEWRVIALDQRGHGYSDHAPNLEYSRESYIQDIHHLLQHLKAHQPVTILGHSLGGVNAYQFAARYPDQVEAVIVEDIGVEIDVDLSFANKLSGVFPTLVALKEHLRHVGVKAVDYFSQSVIQSEQGWRLLADLNGIPISQQQLNGSWWADWQASSCPILLIRGGKSFVLDQKQAEKMVASRPNTKLEVFEKCGHSIHDEEPEEFCKVVRRFLVEVEQFSDSVKKKG